MCNYVTNFVDICIIIRSMNRININKYTSLEILEQLKSPELANVVEFEFELSENRFEKMGIKSFVDLAQIYFFKIKTISQESDNTIIGFKRLNQQSSFHKELPSNEKYGTQSDFFDIDKLSQFSFLHYYIEALNFVNLSNKQSVLNIGVNKGDEFSAIKDLLLKDTFKSKYFKGIDYSKSAIDYAKEHFKEDSNVDFKCGDINKLEEMDLQKFDLLISIGTLQSSNINFNAKFMELYQNHLNKNGAIILGFPNCRWIDGEMVYGAKAPNYPFNEMSLVLKDIHFCKKYLQQKGYRVVITGKDYLFLSARKIHI